MMKKLTLLHKLTLFLLVLFLMPFDGIRKLLCFFIFLSTLNCHFHKVLFNVLGFVCVFWILELVTWFGIFG